MYKRKYNGTKTSQIKRICTEEGESLEEMIRRQQQTKEAIDDSAPMIYTPKKDGVIPEYDPRTDRQETAIDALDKFHKTKTMEVDDEPTLDDNGNIIDKTDLDI